MIRTGPQLPPSSPGSALQGPTMRGPTSLFGMWGRSLPRQQPSPTVASAFSGPHLDQQAVGDTAQRRGFFQGAGGGQMAQWLGPDRQVRVQIPEAKTEYTCREILKGKQARKR